MHVGEIIALPGDNYRGGRRLAPMSAARSGKSHAAAWTLSILAVPVLYLLSVPPLCYGRVLPAGWVAPYAAPFEWLGNNTVLGKLLGPYNSWWLDRL